MVGGVMPHSLLSTGWLMRLDSRFHSNMVGALDIADQIVALDVIAPNNRANWSG